MNFKTTYVMFGFLAVIVVLLLVILFYKPDPELARGGYILPSANEKDNEVKVEKIKRVEIVRSQPTEQKFVFERGAGNKWVMVEPARYRIDSGTVESLVGQLLHARRAEQDIRVDMKDSGLDNPKQVCTLTADDDRSW